MTISFLYPVFLLLLLGIPLLWFWPQRLDNRTHGVLRSVLAAALILALARPVLLAPDGEVFQVLILDASDSVTAQQREQAQSLTDRWFAQVADKDRSAVIVVGDVQAQAVAAERFAGAGALVRLGSRNGDDASAASSPLSAALAAAERQIPAGSPGAVTLISDGLATDRHWGPVVQTLIRRGIAVNTADLGRDEDDVYPAALRTEEVLRAGQTVKVEVRLLGRASGARVRLLDSEDTQLAISAPFDSETGLTVPLQFEPRRPGFMTVRAEVLDAQGDSRTDNNVLERTLAIQPPLRMLYLGERMRHGSVEVGGLLGGGFDIEDGSDWDLNSLPDLSAYDVVMVDDRTAARMPEAFQQHLATAVRERGLGLVFAGGKAAFGAGGYDETTLAQTLPVDLQQKTEKRDPSAALALIIDTSGSMGGSRIELAKQVARLAVRRLKAHDRVGIVEFYGNKHWALPLQSAANKVTIDRAIGRMQAIGGTVLYPAIEEAYYGLKNMATRYKHILIVTDAGIEDSDYESLVRRIARDNINVSTVLVGAQAHSQSLIDMASWGSGRFYSASDRFALPEVILKQPSTMKLPAYKDGAFPVIARGAAGWWGDIDRDALPALRGYVETNSRPGAEVLVEVQGSSHPVLATWHYGLGRVTALMTEPVGPGTAGWRDWNDYGRMLARVIQRTADESQAFRYALRREGSRMTLSARRYSPAATHYPQAAVLDAGGQAGQEAQRQDTLRFNQLAPGYFVADFAVDPATELRVSAAAVDVSGQSRPRGELRLVSMPGEDVAAENQVDPAAGLDLQALAQATAGAFIDIADATGAQFAAGLSEGQSALKLYRLWWWALLLALLVYLGELIWRRWPRT
jgi:Mg-chelatase subunit ChlD